MTDEQKSADIATIMQALPHRYPFLLVDKITDYSADEWIKAIKNVTINEPFFQGHFPQAPVMPGVLILEALAQASGMLAWLSGSVKDKENPLFYLVKIDKARFSRTVGPGDQLQLEARQIRMLKGMGLYDCIASVDGKKVATAEVLCAQRGGDQ